VNLGVTEHLPDYGRSLATYRRLLKPGGKMYLDASASRKKYNFHSFIYKHIYPGNCSPLCLHDYLTELAKTPFRLRGIYDDRHSYFLTARHWAQNLERNREEIVRSGDESLFRKFQVYLWGTVDVFRSDVMQAYRWVLELP
jgi:cyclopropane-fatty-acyl-phospholipid synthase